MKKVLTEIKFSVILYINLIKTKSIKEKLIMELNRYTIKILNEWILGGSLWEV